MRERAHTETFVYTNTGADGVVPRARARRGRVRPRVRDGRLWRASSSIDPLELRRRNYAGDDQDKQRPYSHKHLDECYAQGAERFGWRARAIA